MKLLLAILPLALAAAARAQNCGNTSVGMTPLIDLGPGSYQGFQGGLYAGGGNLRPQDHEIAGLAQAARVVPRDALGQPHPSGRIVVMSVGMSNAAMHFNAFQQLSNADPLRSSAIFLLNGAQGGIPAEEMDDPTDPYWTTILPQKLSQAGVTPLEVQVVWLLQANASPTAPFPAHAQALQAQIASIVRILRDQCPNTRIVYGASRIYAGYATTQLNPEPYAYEQAFAVKWLIEQQRGGDPTLNWNPELGAVEAPWITWGAYSWADGLIPRSDGLTWVCSDFQPDGTHPSPRGTAKNAQLLLQLMHGDSTARSWYLAEPDPVPYGVGKLTSLGTTPRLGWSGAPSFTASNLHLTLEDAVPGHIAIGVRGPRPGMLPFANGTLYVAPPLQRLPPKLLSSQGSLDYALPIFPGMVGMSDHFSVWFRDPLHPDGTGVGLSDGLQVRYRL